MEPGIDVEEVIQIHRNCTLQWHESAPVLSGEGVFALIEQNHLENFNLWHEEDVARRDDLGADRVRQAKRMIDRCNQKRNDLVEGIDRSIVMALNPRVEGCPFNSETPGMMIDRLSVLSLREFHMAEEALRNDAVAEHRRRCFAKLQVIRMQQQHLRNALAELLDQIKAGTRSFRTYSQFKMYNDTELNPQLRGEDHQARQIPVDR